MIRTRLSSKWTWGSSQEDNQPVVVNIVSLLGFRFLSIKATINSEEVDFVCFVFTILCVTGHLGLGFGSRCRAHYRNRDYLDIKMDDW